MENKPNLPDEPASIVGNVLATLDCLFTLDSIGEISGLMDSTMNTLLGNAVVQLTKAYDLLTTPPTNEEGDRA
jgi:hypothetical protein